MNETAICNAALAGRFVSLEGGAITLGSEAFYPEERPRRQAEVAPFELRVTEVTNREFSAFVEATGYLTVAERPAPETGVPGSAVFVAPSGDAPVSAMSWWHWVDGASWRHPEGPDSTIDQRMDHPVVQISFGDAIAYTDWAGERLPTEAEWEYAADAGRTTGDLPYRVEGEDRVPTANTWQGFFPFSNDADDGFVRTAPSGCYDANAFGLYDMIGNVWEWTSAPEGSPTATVKGGSFLCAPNFCMRYRPAARQAQETGLGTNHIGFRTVRGANTPSQ